MLFLKNPLLIPQLGAKSFESAKSKRDTRGQLKKLCYLTWDGPLQDIQNGTANLGKNKKEKKSEV